jgi:hypothetical protein
MAHHSNGSTPFVPVKARDLSIYLTAYCRLVDGFHLNLGTDCSACPVAQGTASSGEKECSFLPSLVGKILPAAGC